MPMHGDFARYSLSTAAFNIIDSSWYDWRTREELRPPRVISATQPFTLTGEGVLNPNAQVDIKFKDTQQGEVILSSGEKWQTSDGGAHWNFVK